jgi:hypothetical protein
VDTDFSASKTFDEAHERHERGGGDQHEASRWVPIAAAVLAVVAALVTLLTNQRASQSLNAKNDAILAVTRAADTYNEYEARSIKQHAYESLIAAGVTSDPKRLAALQGVASRENTQKQPVLARARAFEKAAARDEERSERLLHARETFEISVTLLEVAIVLTSISAVARARFLPIVAGIAAGLGFVEAIRGFF